MLARCLSPARTGFAVALLLLILTSGHAREAQITPFEANGYHFDLSVTVPGDTMEAFNSFTGDIKPWWDHSFSDDPKELRIDPFAGGMFFEDMGNGGTVRHAVVIWAEPGVGLRLDGPLGLSGRALQMVTTVEFDPVGETHTQVTVSANLLGQVDNTVAETVRKVWFHFLDERFRPYMEGTLDDED